MRILFPSQRTDRDSIDLVIILHETILHERVLHETIGRTRMVHISTTVRMKSGTGHRNTVRHSIRIRTNTMVPRTPINN